MPGRRGRSAGVSPGLAHHMEVTVAAACVRADGEDPLRLHRQRRGGAFQLQSSSSERRPFQATRVPPSWSSGEASSARVERRPTARAVTASKPSRAEPAGRAPQSAHPTTSAFSIPAASIARRMNSHLRPTDSISTTCAVGRATARARPGNPAPEPISAIRAALARDSTSRPERLSSTWTRQARGGLGHRADRGALPRQELEHGLHGPASRRAERGSGAPLTPRRAARRRRSGGARRLRCRSRRRSGP